MIHTQEVYLSDYQSFSEKNFNDNIINHIKYSLLSDIIGQLDFNVEIIEYSDQLLYEAENNRDYRLLSILKRLRYENSKYIKVTLNI